MQPQGHLQARAPGTKLVVLEQNPFQEVRQQAKLKS